MAKASRVTKKRMLLVTVVFLCLLAVVGLRVAWIQIVRGEKYKSAAMAQQTRDSLITASRGSITDRNGKVLAQSATSETVSLVPRELESDAEAQEVSKKLAELLDLEYEDVYEKASDRNSYYAIIKRRVDTEVADELREAKLTGVRLDEDSKRYYPFDHFASHVIGFTGTDNQGLNGVESAFDDVLQGKQGRVESMKNASGQNMPYSYEKYVAPEDGQDVVLTIDETLQHFAEKHLETALEENALGNGAACIMMNPNTGEILAMANKPDFDLNDPFALQSEEAQEALEKEQDETKRQELKNQFLQKQWRNKAVNDTYEPGSTFKTITSSMAFEENVVKLTDVFTCTGVKHVGTYDIHCWHTQGHGTQTYVQAIGNSCNPAFMEIGARIGTDSFVKYFQSFGLTQKTGFDLPGEASGIFYDPDNFGEVDLAVSSFGQGFEITPIQMITAVSAVVNGGNLMKPHIIKEYRDKDGNVVKSVQPEVIRQVVSKETSDTMRTVLESVVSSGTAKNAYLKGYRVGGKTGTSEKQPRGNGLYTASFIGFAPADDPQIICLVLLDEPHGASHQGGVIAAPVVGAILEDALKYLGVEQQFSQDELLSMDISTPEVRNMSVAGAERTLTNLGFHVTVKGNGETVTDQVPKPGAKLQDESTVILYTEGITEQKDVEVPDLTGLTVLECNRKLTELGLNLQLSDVGGKDVSGSTVATKQSPAAGTNVSKSSVVYVEFRDMDVD